MFSSILPKEDDIRSHHCYVLYLRSDGFFDVTSTLEYGDFECVFSWTFFFVLILKAQENSVILE